MRILVDRGMTFNDVLLVPQESTLRSRSEATPYTQIGNIKLKIPIISANMDSISGIEMATAMGKAGGASVLHRFESPVTILQWIKRLVTEGYPAIPSIGVKTIDWKNAYEYRKWTDAICIDVAHGDSIGAIETLHALKELKFNTVIAGNVATADGAYRLVEAGANVIKVGIGPGSVCETRSVTGHGVPQLTAVQDVSQLRNLVHIIADGGMNSSGDIVKALAMGADAIMTGSLLAGTDECNMSNIYRGMASAAAQSDTYGTIHNNAPEGIQQTVSEKGPVNIVLDRLVGGIRSGMSYSGARTLGELRKKAVFMMVSPSTVHENGTRKI